MTDQADGQAERARELVQKWESTFILSWQVDRLTKELTAALQEAEERAEQAEAALAEAVANGRVAVLDAIRLAKVPDDIVEDILYQLRTRPA